MCEEEFRNALTNLCADNHLAVALDSRKTMQNEWRIVLEKKKIPDNGWSDFMIEQFVGYLASLDTNNFMSKCGVGEREGRIACQLVAKRHYGFSHGIGRSGDLEEPQPKAVGSSILNELTNSLCLDLIQTMGIHKATKAILVPMATGMTLSLCFLTLTKRRPDAKYILWSRIDQKSCVKSMLLADLVPIVIDTISSKDGLITNIREFSRLIESLGTENILCIFSTTSCFAPRQCDNILELSKLAADHQIPHVVNNAYGLQSKFFANKIQHAQLSGGRIDLFVQSTDKNLMVPVGGAIVAGFDRETVRNVARNYAGRASSSQSLDVCMTLLSLGKIGYSNLVNQRQEIFEYLNDSLKKLEKERNNVDDIVLRNNPISVIFSLDQFDRNDVSRIGSMLFKRNVFGGRVVTGLDHKSIGSCVFEGWGSHSIDYRKPYLTVAAGLGVTKDDVNVFISKLIKLLKRG